MCVPETIMFHIVSWTLYSFLIVIFEALGVYTTNRKLCIMMTLSIGYIKHYTLLKLIIFFALGQRREMQFHFYGVQHCIFEFIFMYFIIKVNVLKRSKKWLWIMVRIQRNDETFLFWIRLLFVSVKRLSQQNIV